MHFSEIKAILKDKTATHLIILAAIICLVNLVLSWLFGSLTLLAVLLAFSLSSFFLRNVDARIKVQNAITTILAVIIKKSKHDRDDDEKVKVVVDKELDFAIESFFKRIIKNFISSWYSTITQDGSFVLDVKVEITEAIREIARRLRNVDHSRLISNKLLPVVYSHFEILERIIQKKTSREDQISTFIESKNPIHPASFSRNSELNYLRFLSKGLLRILVSRKHFECKVVVDLLKEVLTCSVLLPLTDVLSDPGIINLLVILATNPKVQTVDTGGSQGKKVILLQNFLKKFSIRFSTDGDDDEDDVDQTFMKGNFLKDQEKLYSFMQHLKSKNSADIEVLKFYLDVEHLNEELEKLNVMCDPLKLSELQQRSEKLLIFYQNRMVQKGDKDDKPDDLLKAYEHAQRFLDAKWKNDFYKSGEYFQLIYGDKETSSSIPDAIKASDFADSAIPHQKLSTKIKNVMSIRTGTIEGFEATEIPIWDALDHPLGSSSYYSSVAVKLRKERGQDLEGFMQAFFHSIEQEADLGEDIASTQTAEEAKARQKKNSSHIGNVELFKNLFNISGQVGANRFMTIPIVKTSLDSAIYFLASILNIHQTLLRFLNGFLRLLPQADAIISALISKFLHKVISHSILAKLIHELEEKVFDLTSTVPPTQKELTERHELATTRIEGVNKNLGKVLLYLQNPVLNKHLVYCLTDVVIVELFPELNLEAKD